MPIDDVDLGVPVTKRSCVSHNVRKLVFLLA